LHAAQKGFSSGEDPGIIVKLLEVIKLENPKKWTKRQLENEAVEEASELLDIINSFEYIEEHAKTREEQKNLESVKARIAGKLQEAKQLIVAENGSLPEILWGDDESDALVTVSRSYRASLSSIRALADKLGFIIMPYGYIDDACYEQQKIGDQEAIDTFTGYLGENYSIYILAPISYYSVEKHVNAEEDVTIYAGSPCAQAFMAINMAIPMFRSLAQGLQSVSNQVRQNTHAISENRRAFEIAAANSKQELANLAKRIDQLQKQVEDQQTEALIERVKKKTITFGMPKGRKLFEEDFLEEPEEKTTAKSETTPTKTQKPKRQKIKPEHLTALRAKKKLWVRESLLIALPEEEEVTGESAAVIGPCIGPQFSEIAMAALGLKPIAGQAEKIKQSNKLWKPKRIKKSRSRNYMVHYPHDPHDW